MDTDFILRWALATLLLVIALTVILGMVAIAPPVGLPVAVIIIAVATYLYMKRIK